jgi:hypothetical protein
VIPSIVTDTSITFVARGRPFSLANDHANFHKVRQLLEAGTDDVDSLVHLVDIRCAVADVTGGEANLTEEGLFMNGKALSAGWAEKAVSNPESLRVLKVKSGDRIRVEGDEDAPDGIYVVGSCDDDDEDQRVYVEEEGSADGFFGFIQNTSVKEVLGRTE